MKPGALVYVFFSALRLSISYSDHRLVEKKSWANIREVSRESYAERAYGQSAQLWKAFEIRNYILHYIQAVGDNQRKTGAKPGAYISVVEVAILCWPVGSWHGEPLGHVDYERYMRNATIQIAYKTQRKTYRIVLQGNTFLEHRVAGWEKDVAET